MSEEHIFRSGPSAFCFFDGKGPVVVMISVNLKKLLTSTSTALLGAFAVPVCPRAFRLPNPNSGSSVFIEALLDQLFDRFDRALGVLAVGLHHKLAALGRG